MEKLVLSGLRILMPRHMTRLLGEIVFCWSMAITHIIHKASLNMQKPTRFMYYAISLMQHILYVSRARCCNFWPTENILDQRKGQIWEDNWSEGLSKSNFLKICGAAHIRAFTETNVQATFHKTGLISFNPAVVTKKIMVPSIEMSCKDVLPLVPSTLICFINNVIRKLSQPQPNNNSTHQLPIMDSQHELVHIAASVTLHDLSETSISFLYSGQPIQSMS